MNRYHKEVFTDPGHYKGLQTFTDRLNGLKWRYTKHSVENIKYRVIDLESVLLFIRDLQLESRNIFEYYLSDKGEPEKVCFRISYLPGLDIILVMGEDKEIITIYLNSSTDKHETLKRELYTQGEAKNE